MESLTKDEVLLEHARLEFLDQRYAQARRAQLMMLLLGLALFGIGAVILILDGAWLSASIALGFCLLLAVLHFRSIRLSKEAFLASKAHQSASLRREVVVTLGAIGIIVMVYWLRSSGG